MTVPPSASLRTASLADLWPDYSRWNQAIAEEFFSGRWRGRPVYLDLASDVLARIAARVGGVKDDLHAEFLKAVSPTLNLPPAEGRVFERQRTMLGLWRQTDRQDPPWCIALLALLALVAEGMVTDERFSAGNYYGRLCDLLGISEEAHRNKIQRDFRKDTHGLWDALNGWLDDAEYAYGRPTAYAFDSRKHVGIPISQALVKEHDRRRLRAAFRDYGLAPGQRLALPEMVTLLVDWAPRSNLSKALKALWKQPDARERIAGIAQLELEAWTGEVDLPEGEARRDAVILLAATLYGYPLPRLDLSLLVRRSDTVPTGVYSLRSDASQASRAALQPYGGSLRLQESALEDWLEFAECSDISMPDLLLANVVLERSGEAPFALSREMRRLTLLKLDQTHRIYIECPRTELGETHLIVAHHSLARELREFLGTIARPGFREATPAALRGLPEAWVAFWPVEIIGIAESNIQDLNVLTPASRIHVSLSGGFVLPGRSTWHSWNAPEAHIAALDEGNARALLISTQSLDDREYPVGGILIGAFENSAAFNLARLETPLVDGDYRLMIEPMTGDEVGEPLTSIALRLRSANHPRPLAAERLLPLQHCFSSPGWAAVAAVSSGDTSEELVTVTGATVRGIDTAPPSSRNLAPPPLRPNSRGLVDLGSEVATPERSQHAHVDTPPCLVGAHYFWIPGVRPGRHPAEIRGRCVHCGLVKWYFRRRKRRDQSADVDSARAGAGALAQAAAAPYAQPLPAAEQRLIDFDDLLDALTYARSGNWAAFTALAAQIDDSPWFPIEAARALSALGHLDISLDRATFRPDLWMVSPPVLAILPQDDESILCGARSRRLISQLRAAVEAAGGTLSQATTSLGPSIVRAHRVNHRDLTIVAEIVSDAVGMPVVVMREVPLLLLSILPTIATVVASLRTVSWPPLPAESYDFELGAWRGAAAVEQPGAYRFRTQPWLYAYVSPESVSQRQMQICDARLTKFLAAASCGRSLVGYDPDRRRLIVPWGSQLPGLYERTAVLCSGEPPMKMSNGTLEYAKVPPAVASALWDKLRPGH